MSQTQTSRYTDRAILPGDPDLADVPARRSPGAFCVACGVATLGFLFPYALVGLAVRLVLALVVFVAGQGQVSGPSVELTTPHLNWTATVTLPMTIKEGVYQMFERAASVPLPASIAAPLVSFGSFILPICLVLGLATRFAAIGLLVVAALLIAAAPETFWTTTIYWISLSLVLISLGPGLFSLDCWLRHLYRK